MDKKNVLFLPLTVSGYRNRQQGVKATWGKDVDIHWLNKENGFENIPLDFAKDYLPKEIPPGYKWYVFCDDDSYIFVDRLLEVLDQHGSDSACCIGNIIHLGGDTSATYPSGVCFAISHAGLLALRKFVTEEELLHLPRHYNHDVTFGMWCRTIGVQLIHVDGMHGTHPWTLGHGHDVIKQALAYNHVGPEDMPRLEEFN